MLGMFFPVCILTHLLAAFCLQHPLQYILQNNQHVIDEKTKAQKGLVNCPRTHSCCMAQPLCQLERSCFSHDNMPCLLLVFTYFIQPLVCSHVPECWVNVLVSPLINPSSVIPFSSCLQSFPQKSPSVFS